MLKGNHGNKGQRAARGHKKFALATVAATILLGTTGAWSQVMAPSMQSPQSVLGTTSVLSATPLSLARAIELAMESNPEVAAATRQVEASEGQVIQGRVRPNPELAYSLEDTRSQTRTQSWQLNLPIELGGKRAARTKAAEKAREQALAQLADVRATVRANVVAAFFDVLTAQERLALAKDSSALAKSSTDAVAKRVAAGKVSPVEETKARVAESGIRVELSQAASEERNALTRLNALLGRTTAVAGALEGKADDLPRCSARWPLWSSEGSFLRLC
ncbi:MAG TPA: TolC family protein [Burkholderiaceae bacterium]|nr:TolC family protein [Burkholderiaceae bacterium]